MCGPHRTSVGLSGSGSRLCGRVERGLVFAPADFVPTGIVASIWSVRRKAGDHSPNRSGGTSRLTSAAPMAAATVMTMPKSPRR